MTAAVDDTVPTVFVIVPAPKEPSEAEELMRDAEKRPRRDRVRRNLEGDQDDLSSREAHGRIGDETVHLVSETVSDPYGKAEKVKEILKANEFTRTWSVSSATEISPRTMDGLASLACEDYVAERPNGSGSYEDLASCQALVQGANTFNGWSTLDG